MERTNLTIQLDAEIIRRARIVAAKRGTSVSALVARQLIDLVEDDERFEDARARAQGVLHDAVARGGRRWTRDELYDPAREA